MMPRREDVLINSFKGIRPASTGDRLVDLALLAFAGHQSSEYLGEFKDGSNEYKWADAVLSGQPMSPLDLSVADGLDLTHSVFYTTDFGRRPILHDAAVKMILSASLTETDVEVLAEYAVAMRAVGGYRQDDVGYNNGSN